MLSEKLWINFGALITVDIISQRSAIYMKTYKSITFPLYYYYPLLLNIQTVCELRQVIKGSIASGRALAGV